MIPPMLPLDWDAMEKRPSRAAEALKTAIEVWALNPDDWDLRSRVFLLSGYVWGALVRLEEEKAAVLKAYDDVLIANMRGTP